MCHVFTSLIIGAVVPHPTPDGLVAAMSGKQCGESCTYKFTGSECAVGQCMRSGSGRRCMGSRSGRSCGSGLGAPCQYKAVGSMCDTGLVCINGQCSQPLSCGDRCTSHTTGTECGNGASCNKADKNTRPDDNTYCNAGECSEQICSALTDCMSCSTASNTAHKGCHWCELDGACHDTKSSQSPCAAHVKTGGGAYSKPMCVSSADSSNCRGKCILPQARQTALGRDRRCSPHACTHALPPHLQRPPHACALASRPHPFDLASHSLLPPPRFTPRSATCTTSGVCPKLSLATSRTARCVSR